MPAPLNHQHLGSQETISQGQSEKHNDVSWEPGEGQVKVESSLEVEICSQQGERGIWLPGPTVFNTTGKNTRKGRKQCWHCYNQAGTKPHGQRDLRKAVKWK